MYRDISTICTTNQHWIVNSLANTNVTYAPPTGALINPCQCNSVGYTLVQACASCQDAIVGRWDAWIKNCPDAFATSYWPYDVPSQTTIPPWAMLSLPSDGGVWNATAARAYAGTSSSCMRDKSAHSLISASPSSTVIPPAASSHEVASSSPGFRISSAAFICSLIGTAFGSILITALLIIVWERCWWTPRHRGSSEPTPQPDQYNTWPLVPRSDFMRGGERNPPRR